MDRETHTIVVESFEPFAYTLPEVERFSGLLVVQLPPLDLEVKIGGFIVKAEGAGTPTLDITLASVVEREQVAELLDKIKPELERAWRLIGTKMRLQLGAQNE